MLSPLKHMFWLANKENGYKMDIETFLTYKIRLYRLVGDHMDDIELEPDIYAFIITEFLENIQKTSLKDKLTTWILEKYNSNITIWEFFDIFDEMQSQIYN